MKKEKTIIWFNQIIMIGLLLWLIASCKKNNDDSTNTPVLTTATTANVTLTTATSGGTITSDGGSTVTARGLCWSTGKTPTITDSKTTDGAGIGNFTSNITGLSPSTTYYLRAYATNKAGTGYGNAVSITTQQGVVDVDGNVYHAVTIGTQTWTVENLKTAKYSNGTAIPHVTDATAWVALTTPAYCWYINDAAAYKNMYGALYNWYTVNTGKLCPSGWHVPSDDEWTTLETYLGGSNVAGGKMKETGTEHWMIPNTGATNESGFSALPGGLRNLDGAFQYITNLGYWWSTKSLDATYAWNRYLRDDDAKSGSHHTVKTVGFSIRCIKD